MQGEDKLACPTCDGYRKPQFETCWNCHRSKMETEGRVCECGKLKRPEFKDCRECGATRRVREREDRDY